MSYQSEVLADNPVGYWRFLEASGPTAADSSVKNHPGTYTGGTLGGAGPVTGGKALTLNGSSDVVTVPHHADFALTTDMTLEMWIKLANITDYQMMLTKCIAGGYPQPFEWRIDPGSGQSNLTIYGNSLGDAVPVGTWQHLAITVSGTTIRHYRNGAQVATATDPSRQPDGGTPLLIGSRNDGYNFEGSMAEVAVYSTALSAARLLAHFNAAVTATQPILSVTPASLTFNATAGGANPAAQNLSVANTGDGTLNFTVSDDAAWLTVAPASGTAPQALTCTAATGALAAGTYNATITVTSAGSTGSPKTIPVSFVVAAAAGATLRFNGSSSWINGVGAGAMNGAVSIAMLLKRQSVGAAVTALGPADGGNNATWTVGFRNTNKATRYDGALSDSTTTIADTTDWWLLCVTWTATAGTKPRFHFKNITTGGAWVHEDGSSNRLSGSNATSFQIGRFAPASEYFPGDIGLLGWWMGTTLSDLQVEALATNKKTSDWNAVAPSSLTELTSLTPTDLKGAVTWTPSNVALTGANPPGWTFDGLGGSGPAGSGGSSAMAGGFLRDPATGALAVVLR